MGELHSEAARVLAAARPRGPLVCQICGASFVGYTTGKRPGRYCSRPCQQRGYQLSHAEQERARKRRARERRKE